MRYADQLKRNSTILAVLALAVLGTVAMPSVVRAESTIINTVVCGSLPAALNITSPASGTVIAQSSVQITGTIERVSQIRVSVDGVFHETIPVSVSDTTFAYTYTVPIGTHTITLTGVDVCQNADAEQSIVLGFAIAEAVVPPPSPNANPNSSNVPGAPAAPVLPPSSPLSQLEGTPFGRVIAGLMYNSMVALDLAKPNSFAEVPIMTARFVMTAVGLTAMVFPAALYAGYKGLQATAIASLLPNLGVLGTSQGLFGVRVLGLVLALVPIIFLA